MTNLSGDYYDQGILALYDAIRFLRPSKTNFVDFVIDGNINSSIDVYGSVLMKNTTSGQVDKTYYIEGATLEITDDSGDDTNVSIEKNLTVRARNGGLIDCGSTFAPITIHLDDGADIFCDIGGFLAIDENVNVKMGGDNSCMVAYNGGTMTINESLELFAGFIQVGEDATLEIESTPVFRGTSSFIVKEGAVIESDDNISITVKEDAFIDATGTAQNPITFTSLDGTPNRSDWGTLNIYSSNNTLEHCIVEGSDWGIKMYGTPSQTSGNIVRNCILRTNDQGLRIENSEVRVEDCEIYDNRHGVVTINNEEVDFSSNHIYDNDRDGIYTTSGNYLILDGNVIENNGQGHAYSTHGIYIRNSDVIYCSGYNTIRNNWGQEINMSYGNPSVNVYYSSIHKNSGYELYNDPGNSNTLYTNYSWFGESPPDNGQFYGAVSINTPLTSQPAWEGSTSKALSPLLSKSLVSNNSFDRSKERIQELKALISAAPATNNAKSALSELYAIIRSDYKKNEFKEKDSFYNFLDGIDREYKNLEIGSLSLKYKALWKALEDDKNSAIVLSEKALESLSGNDRIGVLEHLIYLYLYTNQISKAEDAFSNYNKEYAFDKVGIEFLTEMIAERKNEPKGLDNQFEPQLLTTEKIPETLTLLQNYPNPGNPTTTIQFQLPEESPVTLKIFNMLGQEVKTLINGHKAAGAHSVTWDSRDKHGLQVPSGIYVYTLKTKDNILNNKLLLLK